MLVHTTTGSVEVLLGSRASGKVIEVPTSGLFSLHVKLTYSPLDIFYLNINSFNGKSRKIPDPASESQKRKLHADFSASAHWLPRSCMLCCARS